ncbi:MAG: hypothetical protein AAF467_19645 [Actinomycetota bacterium]
MVRLRTRLPMAVMAATVMILAACSSGGESAPDASGPRVLAETMIADDMVTAVGLGPLSPTCVDPGSLAIGSTFSCTATTEIGSIIEIDGRVNDDGHLGLATTNLITAAALPSFERQVAANLNETVGSNFTAESVDCGSTAVVLGADRTMACAIVLPSSGQVFDVTLTVSDLDDRAFALQVAGQPRDE